MNSEENKINVVIIDKDDSMRYALSIYLSDKDYLNVVADFSSYEEGYEFILNTKPDIVMVDISFDTRYSLEFIAKLNSRHEDGYIFVSSTDNSPNLIMQAMHAGAREFLLKPYNKNDLEKALEKVKKVSKKEKTEEKKGKVFTVFSNKGGIGKTTIATNLAYSLADITKQKVALVDLNLQLGDIATFMDLSPSFDLSYLIKNMDRADESFLLSSLEKYKNKNLYVLAEPSYLEQAEEITSEKISDMINKLRETFSYVVIDTSSHFDSKTLAALDMTDYIFMVMIVNLPSIRNAQRCLDLFKRLGYEDEKIKILINRYNKNDEIKIDDVEEVLKHKIYHKIPNDYYKIMSSINKGITLSELKEPSFTEESFKHLACVLSGHKNTSSQKTEKNDVNKLSLIKKLIKKLK